MKFGKLEKVDLRELWKGEATEFTPWLAQEENMAQLGEAIGLELEVQEQESNVGPFRADILCKDTLTDQYVLIENQLERTDHNHLGQLLTYAAGLDAVTIIWIAKYFSEEHRATLDWLNNVTEENINFFGIEIEAYRIGESVPAPMFNIVAKPNEWSKTVKKASITSQVSETKMKQMEYWDELRKYLISTGSSLKCRNPQPQHWYNFSIGKSTMYLSTYINTREQFIGISLIIKGANKTETFNTLKEKFERDASQKISSELEWRELPEAKESQIRLLKEFDPLDRSTWSQQHEWFKDYLEKFEQYFRPKIRTL